MFVYKNSNKVAAPCGARSGFTFIEVAVAIAVVGVGLLAVLGTLPLSLRATTSESSSIQAGYLAQDEIETLLGTPYGSLTPGVVETKHDLGGNFAGFQREAIVSLIDSNYKATSTDAGIKQIKVTVWWPRSFATQSVVLQSILSRR